MWVFSVPPLGSETMHGLLRRNYVWAYDCRNVNQTKRLDSSSKEINVKSRNVLSRYEKSSPLSPEYTKLIYLFSGPENGGDEEGFRVLWVFSVPPLGVKNHAWASATKPCMGL